VLKLGRYPQAPISAGRTARTLVENAGPALAVTDVVFRMWSQLAGTGSPRVGRTRVVWVFVRHGELAVAHTGADGLQVVGYALKLTRTRTPGGGTRSWWVCPDCSRTRARLYLPEGRERLGCRSCCRLLYASQYPPRRRRARRAEFCATNAGGTS
jgi:hypothetical protein